jgi:hypothetical protein
MKIASSILMLLVGAITQSGIAAHYLVCTTTLTLMPGRRISLIAESA